MEMKKLGLIGEKLGHSYSKIIHERYFEIAKKRIEVSQTEF